MLMVYGAVRSKLLLFGMEARYEVLTVCQKRRHVGLRGDGLNGGLGYASPSDFKDVRIRKRGCLAMAIVASLTKQLWRGRLIGNQQVLGGIDELDNFSLVQFDLLNLRPDLRLVVLMLLEGVEVVELKAGARCLEP